MDPKWFIFTTVERWKFNNLGTLKRQVRFRTKDTYLANGRVKGNENGDGKWINTQGGHKDPRGARHKDPRRARRKDPRRARHNDPRRAWHKDPRRAWHKDPRRAWNKDPRLARHKDPRRARHKDPRQAQRPKVGTKTQGWHKDPRRAQCLRQGKNTKRE